MTANRRTIKLAPPSLQNKRLDFIYLLRKNGFKSNKMASQKQFFEFDPKYESSDTNLKLMSQPTISETVLDHIINRLREKNWPQDYTTIVVPSSVNRNLFKVHIYNKTCNSYLGTTSITKAQLMKLQQDNIISQNCVIFASKDIDLPKDNMMNALLPKLIQAEHCSAWENYSNVSSARTEDEEIFMNTDRTSKWNLNSSTESTTPKDDSSISIIPKIKKILLVEAPIRANQTTAAEQQNQPETDLSDERTIDGPNIKIPLHRPLPIIVPKGLLNCHATIQQMPFPEKRNFKLKSILKASSSESSTSKSVSTNKRKITFMLKPIKAHKSVRRKKSGFVRMNEKLIRIKESRRLHKLLYPLRMLTNEEFEIDFDCKMYSTDTSSSLTSSTSSQTDPYVHKSLYYETTSSDVNAFIYKNKKETNKALKSFEMAEYNSSAAGSDDDMTESKDSVYAGLDCIPKLDLHDSTSTTSNESAIVAQIDYTEAYKNMHIDTLLERINKSIVPSVFDLNLFFDVAEYFKFKIFIRPELIGRSPHDHEDHSEFYRYNIECFMLLDFYVGRITLDHDKLQFQLRTHPSILARIHVINDVYEIVSEVPQSWTQFLRNTFDRFGMQMLYDVIGEFLFDVYKQCSLVKKKCWTEK